MASKNKKDIVKELQHGVSQSDRDIMKDIVDSVASVNGAISYENITSGSDPGVAGKLFTTSSSTVGLSAGYDVILVSKG